MSHALPDPALLVRADRRLRKLARELVSDASGAEDVAQEAWLAALEAGPVHSVSAWLATVARRLSGKERRGSTRRARRERDAARAEALPSTVEILAREETRRRLVETLLALDEPLRTTLVLRFLEDLPPRVVAARMGVPVETVRSRTRRGLEELRLRLDRAFDDRASWCAALTPFLRAPLSPLALPLAAMTLHKTLVPGLVLLLLLVGGALWRGWPRRPARAEPSEVRAEFALSAPDEPAAPASTVLAPLAAAESRALSAQSQPAPAPDLFGSLRVVVSWSDGTPAEGVAVYARPSEGVANPELAQREGRTDPSGSARLAELAPGAIEVVLDRGMRATSAIVAGHEQPLTFQLPRGIDVDGRVEDSEGVPIAGAEVWLARHGVLVDGTLVARTDGAGRFRLRSLSPSYPNLLAASADGFRPSESELLPQTDEEGTVISQRFVLRRGAGAVRGTVRDSATGAPLAQAFVAVGARGCMESRGEGDILVIGPWARLARTDEAGNFRVSGLAPGACALAVRAPGHALWRDELEVQEGRTEEVEASLLPEPGLAGHVLDREGRPVPGLKIVVGRGLEWLRGSDRSDAEGAFHVGALEPDVVLDARVYDGSDCVAFTSFTVRPGETHVWEARLGEMQVLRGRLLDEAEQPLAGWEIELVNRDGHRTGGVTAADGSFRFENLFPREYPLRARAPGPGVLGLYPSLERAGVRPGPDELVLRVPARRQPSVTLRGVFLDEDGGVIPGASVMPWADQGGNSMQVECEEATGRFEVGPLPPGRWRLVLEAPGRAQVFVGPRELGPGETWDCGEVRLAPPGRVVVRLHPEGELGEDPRLRLRQAGWWRPEDLGTVGLERSASLPPGLYQLNVLGPYEELTLPFEVQSGGETVLDVPIRRGTHALVQVLDAGEEARFVELRVSSPGAPAVLERTCGRGGSSVGFATSLYLAPGTYTVEARAGARQASGTLVVELGQPEGIALELHLR